MLTEYELKSILIKNNIQISTEQAMSFLHDINHVSLREANTNVSGSIDDYTIHALYFENHK